MHDLWIFNENICYFLFIKDFLKMRYYIRFFLKKAFIYYKYLFYINNIFRLLLILTNILYFF